MTNLYRVNPALSFGWQAMEPGGRLSFAVRDPLSNRAAIIDKDEFWLLDFLNRMTGQSRTSDQMAAAAESFCSLPLPASKATLRRVWNIIFINEATGSTLVDEIAVWERFDCKLAFEFLAQSLDEGEHLHCASHRASQRANRPASCEPFTSAGEIPLPIPAELPVAPLNSILYGRRTCRVFNGRSIEPPVLSSLLYRALECASDEGVSGSVLYHVIALRAGSLAPGVYKYTPRSHSIALLRSCGAEELESDLAKMLIGQPYVQKCAFALLLWTDTRTLFADNPRPSALRRCLIYAGLMAQRLVLLASAHGLQTFLSAAIADENARRISGDRNGDWHAPMHCLAFGYSGP
jgi:Nitroreductase family